MLAHCIRDVRDDSETIFVKDAYYIVHLIFGTSLSVVAVDVNGEERYIQGGPEGIHDTWCCAHFELIPGDTKDSTDKAYDRAMGILGN